MLQKILIENYRCYQKHEIEFKDITLIVGKNNAGKSTLIEVLRLVSLALSRFKSSNYNTHPQWVDTFLKEKGIKPSIKNIGFISENVFHNYGSPPSIITAYFTDNIIVKVYIGKDEEIFCTLKHGDKYISTKREASLVNYSQLNILPQISPLQKEETLLNIDYVKQNISTGLSSLHFRNQISILKDKFIDFKKLSEETWNGLRIRNFEEGEKLSLLVQDGSFVSEIAWMGHGLQMWLQIIWFLSRINEDEIVVLDEPDVYMHPDLQRKLIRMLKNRFKQVIVATHSVEIISEVEPDNILIIDKENEKSIFAAKIPVVQNILNSIGSIHNLQLTRLWASKKLIIVEGEDIAILKRIQNILFPNSNDPFDSIPNFDIKGWGGWNYARGSNMLLKNTVDKNILVYCLFDSDYFTKKTIDKRYDEAKNIGVQLHIWKRKEIENYLIIPSTILRIIKKNNPTSRLTTTDIEEQILHIIQEKQEETIDIIADNIQNEDRKQTIATARKIAKTGISNWEHRIGGKEIISSLSKWSQAKYNISLSPLKIVQNLHETEIDPEVKSVVEAIEKLKKF